MSKKPLVSGTVKMFTAWKAEVLAVVLGQAYDLNCSSEIFDSKWPWCVQLIYHQESQVSPLSLVFCRVTQMLCSTQGFCWENVKHHRSAQWVRQKCPRFGPAPTMDQGSSFCTSPGSGPLHREPQKGLSHFSQEGISSSDSACLKQAKRACALPWFCISLSHSSQWADVRKLLAFWNIAATRPDRKYCTTPENCPNTSKCYMLLSLNLLI